MTISTTTRRNQYIGSGITGPYAYSFRIVAAADLVVTTRNLSNIEATLAYPAGYSVSGVGDATGSITLTTALPSGYALTIRRVRPLLQTTDIRNQGVYFPEVHEDVFDNHTMVDQQQQDEIDRSMKYPTTIDPDSVSADLPAPEAFKVLGWNAAGTRLDNYSLDANAVALPSEGRTVATLTAYLSHNAVYNIADYGASPSASAAANTAAIHAAMAAAHANGGGRVVVPNANFVVSNITFGSCANVLLEGQSNGIDYGASKSASSFTVTTGTWGIRFPLTSTFCGIRNIGLSSNGSLNSAVPHVVIAPGVEYGVIVETGSTYMDAVDVFGFQYGCVIANLGNSNIFDKCSFVWNTKCGFAITYGSAGAYAAYHPNLVATIPTSLDKTTVVTLRDCKIRRNGWGMILRDGTPVLEGVNVIESNYFGGLMVAIGSLDAGVGLSGRLYLEANWLVYDETAAYTITQNNLLKNTASTWLPWTSAVPTAGNDAGYNLYAWADATHAGTTTGPGSSTFYALAMVNASAGPTPGKAMYLKQCIFWKFYDSGASGGDVANSVKLGDGTGGYFANAVHFFDWSGSLPTGLGNRGAQFDSERTALGGGLTATQGYFRGLAGNLQFPAIQIPSSDANTLDDYEEGVWAPTAAGFTVVGTPTYAGTYTKIGRRVHFRIRCSSTTSVASVAGTSTLTLPVNPARSEACLAIDDTVSYANTGIGYLATSDNKVYPPAIAAVAAFVISGSYDV